MDERHSLTLRRTIANNSTALLMALAVVALVGGGVAYTAHVDPGTETVDETAAAWETTTAYDHSASVTRDNPLFEEGIVLANRDAYFLRITPVLEGSNRFSYDAPEGSVAIRLDSTLVIESTGEDGETTYWRRTRSLDSFERSAVAPGETMRLPFSVNVSAVDEEIEEIQAAVGQSPGETTVAIRTTATYQGTIDGQSVRRSRTTELPIQLATATYTVGDAETGPESQTVTESRTVTRSYGLLWLAGGPLVLLFALAGLGALATLDTKRLALSETEAARLTYLRDRAEYEAYLSRIRPPAETPTPTTADSLSALVDYAIDSDCGVVADPDATPARYHVIDGDTHYVYEAPPKMPSPEPASLLSLPSRAVTDSTGTTDDDT
ncbi:DUF5305 domain-containing protein [Halosegnis longus]|uniref:DUF5305 domain-containing protein n=1 Tax=Halosegnis longus TaxID=2216012 RepID=A0AAJ4R9N5_9EURY|nr:hypothetical protein Nmn1133_10770 [Salella cibi]